MERGVYEPRVNDVSAFDADSDMDDGEEGSRLPLLIVIALLVLAAFTGVVWLAYSQGVESGRTEAPRITAAQNALAKADQQTSLTGLQIYEHPPRKSAGSSAPALRPSAAAAEPPPAAANPPMPAAAPVTKPVVQQATSIPPPAARKTISQPPPAAPHLAAITPTPSATGPAADTAEPAAQISGVLLQIGSYKSEAEARRSWIAFTRRHPAAANYQYDVKEADLGAKGVWYRLRMGSFADKESADTFCEKLRQEGTGCLIAR